MEHLAAAGQQGGVVERVGEVADAVQPLKWQGKARQGEGHQHSGKLNVLEAPLS